MFRKNRRSPSKNTKASKGVGTSPPPTKSTQASQTESQGINVATQTNFQSGSTPGSPNVSGTSTSSGPRESSPPRYSPMMAGASPASGSSTPSQNSTGTLGSGTPSQNSTSTVGSGTPSVSPTRSQRQGHYIEEEYEKCVRNPTFELKIYILTSNDPTVNRMLKACMVRHFKYQEGDEKKSMAAVTRSTSTFVGKKSKGKR